MATQARSRSPDRGTYKPVPKEEIPESAADLKLAMATGRNVGGHDQSVFSSGVLYISVCFQVAKGVELFFSLRHV